MTRAGAAVLAVAAFAGIMAATGWDEDRPRCEAAACQPAEDDAGWDCLRHGNGRCGPGVDADVRP